MKERIRSIISYIAPALITLILSCIILGVQSIWPFGSVTIDYYDMGQQAAPELCQIWDELHGVKSGIFDWYTGLGQGIPGMTHVAPTNLLLYLIPRSMVLESFSIMFLIKVMCMAICMRIFLKKEMPACQEFYSIVLSAGYGLCGFVLMQYTMIDWLDIAMFVPLILMFTQKLLRDGKMAGYIITVVMTFMVSFYLPVMILLFIFLMTGFYLVSLKVKSKNEPLEGSGGNSRPHVLKLGLGTIAALLLSSWTWIPKIMAEAGGARFLNEADGGLIDKYIEIVTHVLPDYSSRWWVLLGVSFAAAIGICGIFHDIKNKNLRRLIFVCGGFVLLFAELLFESVQLMWHFGSYVNYPARNGFLFYLVFAAVAAVYAPEIMVDGTEKLGAEYDEQNRKMGLNVFVGGGFILAILLASVGVFWYQSTIGMSIYDVFRVTMLCVIASFFVYLFLVFFKRGKYGRLCIFLISAELIFYGVALVGEPNYVTGYTEEYEQEDDFVRIVNDLLGKMDIYSSRLDRIKNPDESLNANYGTVLKRATLSGWKSINSYEALSAAANMGYSSQYTRLLDAGGNAFFDALLHETQVLTFVPQDEMLYEKADEAETVIDHESNTTKTYGLYNCRYVLPFGTIIRGEDELEALTASSDTTEMANAFYNAICPEDMTAGTIADRVEYGDLYSGCGIEIEGRKALYITGKCIDSERKNAQIYVNGNLVPVPSLHEPDNTLYSAHFNNNALLMGCFEDETVDVKVEMDENSDEADYNFEIFTIDIDALGNLCSYYSNRSDEMKFSAGGSYLNAVVSGRSGEYLLLPIKCDNGWSAQVNGVKTEITKIDGLFMAVPLTDGQNTVLLKYFPPYMKVGIIISLVSAIGALTVLFFSVYYRKHRPAKYAALSFEFIRREDSVDRVLPLIYTAAWSLLMLGMYVAPVIYGIYYYASEVL